MKVAPSMQWAHLLLVVALCLGIAGFAQAIAERHSARVDWTPKREFSLSESTLRVLEQLPDPIHMTAYYRRDDLRELADLVDLFEGAAPNFHVEFVQLDRNPGRARQDGIDSYGKAVIRYRGESVIVEASKEQMIAGGLLRLMRGRPTRILFLTGHGERDVTDITSPTGYGELRQGLQQDGYLVDAVSLLRSSTVPDADLVVVAGPKNDLLEAETDALDRYLESGGHLLVLIDPVPLPNLQRLVQRHGVEASLDVIRDPTNQIMGSDPFTIPIPAYPQHAITASQTTPALMAVARSVSPGRKAGAEVAAVAQTYDDAWAIRDFERAGNVAAPPREGEDRPGPIDVMATSSWDVGTDRQARLVVIGDSDLVVNGFLGILGNRDLVLNTITWAVAAEALIAKREGSGIEALRPLSPLVLQGNQGRWVFFVTVVIQPALVLAIGGIVAFRRRWRG